MYLGANCLLCGEDGCCDSGGALDDGLVEQLGVGEGERLVRKRLGLSWLRWAVRGPSGFVFADLLLTGESFG